MTFTDERKKLFHNRPKTMTDSQTAISEETTLSNLITYKLNWIHENGFIDEKKYARFQKRLSDEDEDEVSDARDSINAQYDNKYKPPKKSIITPEQLEEIRKEKRETYLKDLPNSNIKSYKEEVDVEVEKYGKTFKDLSSKATRVGMDIIIKELHKLSTDTPKSSIKRANGTTGANHLYYDGSFDPKRNEDGSKMTIVMNNGKKDYPAVILDRSEANPKNLWTYPEFSDKEEFRCLESVCGKLDDDGNKQIFHKDITFDTLPEWNGTGCKVEIDCKKITKFLHKYDKETNRWVRYPLENPPTPCCNNKIDSDGKCKRHNKPNLKSVKEWTSLGGEWASVKL